MPLISQEYLLSPWVSILNIGAPYSGKTRSLTTMYNYMVKKKQKYTNLRIYDLDNKCDPVVTIADREHWLDHLQVYKYNTRVGGKKINKEVAPARSTAEFELFMDEFNGLYDMIDPRTSTWREDAINPPGCIVIDSGTALEDLIYDFVLKKRGREFGEGEMITSGRNEGRTTKDVTGSDWQSIKDKEVEVIESAKGLPCHFVYICHELLVQEIVPGPQVRAKDAPTIPAIATGTLNSVPALTGNLRDTMPKYFSAVLYATREGGQARWQVVPGGRIKMAGTALRDDLQSMFVPQDYCGVLR
jgi:hypothetical protein